MSDATPAYGLWGLVLINSAIFIIFAFIVAGFLLISAAWRVLYEAQRAGTLAATGPYAYVRHPQYVGFVLLMLGFLLQWPTLLTLAMFPVLAWMYARLARQEEREVMAEFGEVYRRYAAQVPAYIPHLFRASGAGLR